MTHTSPSTQTASVPALFVTTIVYVLVPDSPVSSAQESGETDLSIVHVNVRSQWPSAVFDAESGVVALAVGAPMAATMPARTANAKNARSLCRM